MMVVDMDINYREFLTMLSLFRFGRVSLSRNQHNSLYNETSAHHNRTENSNDNGDPKYSGHYLPRYSSLSFEISTPFPAFICDVRESDWLALLQNRLFRRNFSEPSRFRMFASSFMTTLLSLISDQLQLVGCWGQNLVAHLSLNLCRRVLQARPSSPLDGTFARGPRPSHVAKTRPLVACQVGDPAIWRPLWRCSGTLAFETHFRNEARYLTKGIIVSTC